MFTGSQTGNLPRVPEPGAVRGQHGADAVQELPEDHPAGVARQGKPEVNLPSSTQILRGCVNFPPTAKYIQAAGFTQPLTLFGFF